MARGNLGSESAEKTSRLVQSLGPSLSSGELPHRDKYVS